MATRSVSRAKAQSRSPELDLDRTDGRIRAYLASMRPLRGSSGENSDEYRRGRSLIERMAVGVEGCDRPELRLTPAECADVLYFFALSEPIEPREWWHDPEDAPSPVVGHQLVVGVLEDSLRADMSTPAAAQSRPATAEQILAVVDKYQDQLLNLESFAGCIKAKVEAECEGLRLVGAIELLEHELARIGEALEPDEITYAIERQSQESAS